VDVTAEQEQRRLLEEYHNKLCIGEETFPDPFLLKTNWTGEKDGMTAWPSVYIMDISDYLNTKNPDILMKWRMNEYKEGNAYRYFSSE